MSKKNARQLGSVNDNHEVLKTLLFQWAVDEFDPDSNPTKIVPPDEVQQTGLLKDEPMGRQWFNYMMNALSRVVYHLYQETHIDETTPATHEIRLSAIERPDWVEIGFVLFRTDENQLDSSGKIYWYEHQAPQIGQE